MAAIFCNALLAPCKAIARCTEACCNGLTKACGACGGCCEDLCASVAKCCGSCCTALGNCCASCCATLQQCFSKPFSGVVFLTVLLSVVPFCAMIFAVIKFWSNQCSHPLQVWLLICLIVFLINLIFALYLFRRLAGTDFENPEINPRYDANKHEEINQYEHTKHFLMYDPGVCLYIMILLFQIAWAIVGLSWYGDEGTVCSDDARPLLQCVLAGSIILLVFVGIFLIGL
jgi:hypothetical protein